MNEIKIVEVGPRDGLQNEKQLLSVQQRVHLIHQLEDAGLVFIEGGSFVSPKAIPAMADSDQVWKDIKNSKSNISFLVPNQKGADFAIAADVKSVAVFTATSDTFNQKNIHRSVDESLQDIKDFLPELISKGMKVRGYLSTCFGCPYEGYQEPKKVLTLVKKLFEMGCEEVSVGDTIGAAHPKQVKELFTLLGKEAPLSKMAGHFHDTRGMALLNILAALESGIRIFDASVGGLGGCPYATGSSGNVATEELVWWLEGAGWKSGVDLQKLLAISHWLKEDLGLQIRSKLSLAQPKKLYYFKEL